MNHGGTRDTMSSPLDIAPWIRSFGSMQIVVSSFLPTTRTVEVRLGLLARLWRWLLRRGPKYRTEETHAVMFNARDSDPSPFSAGERVLLISPKMLEHLCQDDDLSKRRVVEARVDAEITIERGKP